MGLLKFYDRFPSKSQAVSGAANVFIVTFPMKTTKLKKTNQTLFTHVLVND